MARKKKNKEFRKELRQDVLEALIKGVRRNGERIFDISQNTEDGYVPVDRGTLKKSGYTFLKPNGIEIGYTAPYARDVEFGRQAKPFSGVQKVRIKRHTRKLPKGAGIIEIDEHVRRYVDKRLVGFNTKGKQGGDLIFRVLKGTPATRAQHFLGRATKKGLESLADDIGFYLKRLEQKQKR
jgi:hypothetical protein